MLSTQLSRLLLRQTHRAARTRRQHVCQVAGALPEVLPPCLLRVFRAESAVTAAVSVLPSPSVLSQRLHLCRGFSTSISTHTTKKTTSTTTTTTTANKKKTSAASERRETCQVLDNSDLLVGRMTVAEAENMARKEGLKLIDLGSNSDGLRSFKLVSGRELAEESKRLRLEKKGERVREKEKEVRLTSNITDHDLEVKLRQVKDTLERGGQVKVVIRAHRRVEQSVGERQVNQLLRKVTADLTDLALVKQASRSQGEQQLLLRPKPPSSPDEE